MSGTTTDHLSRVATPRAVSFVRRRDLARSSALPWERALVVGAVAAAAVAVWVTVRAGFLAYPGWLAVQKADFILGPIGVGLYWMYKRPENRLGLLLVALGLIGVPYILESSSNATLFGIGIFWEIPIYVMTSVVIIAFPSGRIEGWAAWLLLGVIGIDAVVFFVAQLITPDDGPGFSISGCRSGCPRNGLAVWSSPEWANHLFKFGEVLVLAIPLGTAALLVWRFVTGTAPRRRALAVGGPIALVFLLLQATYRILVYLSPGFAPGEQPTKDAVQWAVAGARSAIWYGFLFALIAAELYAGRVLRTLVRDALRRPSFGELESMLRGPLGDPGLRLGFRRSGGGGWVDVDGAVLQTQKGQELTEFQREPGPAVALVHDAQLSEDPELLETAAEIALLALEHAELEAAQQASLHELTESRARLTEASDRERRRLERDLHDGAQQRLTAIQVRLHLATDEVEEESLGSELAEISRLAAEAVDELRMLSHGIYPTVLRVAGPVRALRALALRATIPVAVVDEGIGRTSSAVEAAIYFCCSEAVQNATKHAGDEAAVNVTLGRDGEAIRFSVSDDGVGFAAPAGSSGDGLVGMRDRMGAVGGELEIESARGSGTTVRGWISADRLPVAAGE